VLVLALVLVAAAALLAVAAALRGSMPLPVVAHLAGGVVTVGILQAGAAVVVPPALVAVVASLRRGGRLERSAVVLAAGAATPIVLVLVARLNGAAEAMVLVLTYAASGGGILLRSLHRPGGDPMPLRWWAVLGIVPWGAIAFTQIGAGLTGSPPSAAVRVLTIVVLGASVLEFVVAYRRRDAPPPDWVALLLAAAPGLLLGVLVLATG
jgi:hypothetical protein